MSGSDRNNPRKPPRVSSCRIEQVEGRNPVLEALKGPRKVHAVYIADGAGGAAVAAVKELAARKEVPVKIIPRGDLESMASTDVPQGVIARVAPYRCFELEDVLERAKSRVPLLLALDGVEDPHNLGSLLRVADATGVDGVVVTRRRTAPIGPSVARASAGALEHVHLARVANIAATLERLKEEGLWVVGADGDAPDDYTAIDMTMPLVIVLGGEGKGLSRLVRERCDFLVKIPMLGRVSSLNVATAGAVLLYEAVRQRGGG
ncbi:MAG: 23S rRNA (guanosine(2251)-2'-O)-methyltransferase RlmB [Actinobacteria bacterium]|nr:23S rRNA (guanosine(2251)-2'-O)-methyltransferase RlmB [Actinomycetota bacterium]MBU1943405.1 23S rRNA (guanosine(2251)-2'-O)-methyltransferase RlmB [Actinomycetota bacterium]MBU2686762.1 23S rRNA (guanosine(2251)-2'-O)-methyltransferase RlmB [Actinomycetota bacterium]